jgi:hypothetical protein
MAEFWRSSLPQSRVSQSSSHCFLPTEFVLEGWLDCIVHRVYGILDPLALEAPRRGRRTALTFPLGPPPQKN